MPQSEPLPTDENSKSQRKRDMLALQKLGESLIELTDTQLAKIELPERLVTAIKQARSLSSEAKRRQLQLIGKLMRDIDPEPIKLEMQKIKAARQSDTAKFKQTEQWRTKLISLGDSALTAFLNSHPDVNGQQLRQLIRKAQHDVKSNKNTGGEKALFKYLREILKE